MRMCTLLTLAANPNQPLPPNPSIAHCHKHRPSHHRLNTQLEFFAEEEVITIVPSFQLRHNASGMLNCIGVSCCGACVRPCRSMQQHALRSIPYTPPRSQSKPSPCNSYTCAHKRTHNHATGRVRSIPPEHAGGGAYLAGAAAAQARQVPHHAAQLAEHQQAAE